MSFGTHQLYFTHFTNFNSTHFMESCALRFLPYYTSLAAQQVMSQCVGPKMSHNSVSGLVALKKTQKTAEQSNCKTICYKRSGP